MLMLLFTKYYNLYNKFPVNFKLYCMDIGVSKRSLMIIASMGLVLSYRILLNKQKVLKVYVLNKVDEIIHYYSLAYFLYNNFEF